MFASPSSRYALPTETRAVNLPVAAWEVIRRHAAREGKTDDEALLDIVRRYASLTDLGVSD